MNATHLDFYSQQEDGIHVSFTHTSEDGEKHQTKIVFKSIEDYETMLEAIGIKQWQCI